MDTRVESLVVQAGPPSCPLCAHAQEIVLWTAPNGKRRVMRCVECDFTYVWPRWEQDFSSEPEAKYYADWELLDFTAGNYIVSDVAAAEGARARYKRHHTEKPAVLDAGCGAGQLLVHFRAHGWDVEGVEPWRAVTAVARKYFRLNVHACSLHDAPISPATKDVVLAIDVLQFVGNPREFVADCLTALKPDGMLYLTVPNYASAESKRAGWESHYFHPKSYINYFTPETMQRLLEGAGFYRVSVTEYGGADGDLFLRVVGRRIVHTELAWAQISAPSDDADLPPLDRAVAPEGMSEAQAFWRENGYLVMPNLLSDEVIERYCERRRTVAHNEGWRSATPYLDEPAIRDLCLGQGLSEMLEHLLGEKMGLHLNLTGWVSTERDWHQDDYLNPPFVNGHYVAVWSALDQIQPDSGPFEFVPGSHCWPIIRQEMVLRELGFDNGDDQNWPWDSEKLLTPFFEREIKARGAQVKRFLGGKGDVLIWHARLLHRGSMADRPGAERRAMIAHYSALSRRPDMPAVRQHGEGGSYFLMRAAEEG
jgi:2-polyprenyl-3-methyl-5-hydroxy-6-metoxy-1,4-benzoquinol methylase